MRNLNILTFNWHEGYIYLLAKTGHSFDIVVREKGDYSGWMYQFRPLPKNCSLITLSEAKNGLERKKYDLAICHNIVDLYDITQFNIPRVLIFHTKPFVLFNNKGEPIKLDEYLYRVKLLTSSEAPVEIVFVSERKKQLWGIDGRVILHGIDVSEFRNYNGEDPSILMVGQFLKEKALQYGFMEIFQEIIRSFKVTIFGINPNLENARISENWEDLKNQYANKRLYFNLLCETLDDGYNLSMLEAMASGMPVVSIANSTSPIRDGFDGFISNNPGYLKKCIKRLIEDRDFAKELGSRGKKIVINKFSIENFLENWNALFKDLLFKSKTTISKNYCYKPKIYDCFTFFNELDLLEIRLNTLRDVVDYFVVVEATKTFSGKDKELYFQKNKHRFADFNDRIIYIVVDDMPANATRWEREYHQRNAIMRGLKDCKPDDIIIISDVDEIPSPDVIKNRLPEKPVALKQRLFYYFLNCESERRENGPVMLRYKDIITPQTVRDNRCSVETLDNGGWHFSYLGGIKEIKRKIESFAHDEFDTPYFKSKQRLYEKIMRGEDIFERNIKYNFVKIDESYPKYIRDNLDKFKAFLFNPSSESNSSLNYDNNRLYLEENRILRDNLNVMKKVNPNMCKILEAEELSGGYTIIRNNRGLPTVKKGEIFLHSRYEPEREANQWLRALRHRIEDKAAVCVFGFGLGYHLERLINEFSGEIFVFEPDIRLLKLALTLRDLRVVLKRVKIISNYDVTMIKRNFCILKHSPSVRLNQRYFKLVEHLLGKIRIFNHSLKISVVGPVYGGSLPVAEYTVRALKNLGHSVQYIDNSYFKDSLLFIDKMQIKRDSRSKLHAQFIEFASSSVIARIDRFRPDLVIALAQAPLNPEALNQFRRVGLRTCFWFVENYRHIRYWRDMFPYYDYIFVIQKDGFIKDVREGYKKPVHYLPLAALPEFHRPLNLSEDELKEFGSDISFVGAGYRNRQEMFLGLLDYDFKIWGNEWNMLSPLGAVIQRKGERISPEEMVKIFNATKVNINLHSSAYHRGVDPFGDFVNPRTFEIASAGAFQLVDHRKYLPEMFEVGKEMITFSSFEDLRKKIDYYLKNPEERKEIAEASRKRVLREHTYEKRLEEMLQFILEKGFELPGWASTDVFVDEAIKDANDDRELAEFLKAFEEKGRLSFKDILEYIEDGERELTDVEKIFLFMREVKNQYAKG